jgi:xanthine dehydrogenase YagT iron-sulfur-binding subunit
MVNVDVASAVPELLGPDEVTVTLHVNGREIVLQIDPRTTLLDALRERLGLTGTKKGATTVNAAPARY